MTDKNKLTLTIVAAIDDHCGIGKNNTIPWDEPADRKEFYRLTVNHSVLMGRKTFESLPVPLTDRQYIILTRNEEFKAPTFNAADNIDAHVIHNLQDLVKLHREGALRSNEVMVIGGEDVYNITIPYASKAIISHVSGVYDCDKRLPVDLLQSKIVTFGEHEKKISESCSSSTMILSGELLPTSDVTSNEAHKSPEQAAQRVPHGSYGMSCGSYTRKRKTADNIRVWKVTRDDIARLKAYASLYDGIATGLRDSARFLGIREWAFYYGDTAIHPEDSGVYVAYEGEIPVGFVIATPNESNHMYLSAVYVKEDYRRKGIAKQMVEFVKQALGTEHIHAYVHEENEAAIALLRSLGGRAGDGRWLDIYA